MTILAPSAAPAHALRVWTDGITIFVEIPGTQPHIVSLLYSEAALSKLLGILRCRAAPVGGRSREPANLPPTRLAAQAVLRKLGML